MKQRLAKILQGIDRLSLRERLFVLTAGLFMVGGLWQAVLAGPLEAREGLATDKLIALQDRLRELDGSLSVAAAGVSEGVPDQLERLRALRESVAARDEEMRVFTTDLVDPGQMRVVLEELLRRQSGLTLVSAVNRPAQLVLEDENDGDETTVDAVSAGSAGSSDAPKLYRHSFVLRLRGNYLDCLRYLEDVERLPWHIYWSRLEVSTDEYPVNDIVIEVATLSLDEEWIGV
jgi:MSHA biogenesis protein MshJ